MHALGLKFKILITTVMPDMTNIPPYKWLEKLLNSTDKERYKICWDPHAKRNAMLYSGNHFRGLAKYDTAIETGGLASKVTDD